MMRYCFWHGKADPKVDGQWVSEAVQSLNDNAWSELLYVNGVEWDSRRQMAAIKLFESLANNTSCPALTILNATMNGSVTQAFETVLRQNKSLRSLTLENISTLMSQMLDMLYDLPDCIFSNPNLESLSLKKVSLGKTACLGLCHLLRESTSIHTLNLTAVEMDKEAIPSILAAIATSPSVTCLKLSNMKWCIDDIKHLWEALLMNKSITTLIVENMMNMQNASTGASVAQLLQKSKSLVQLSLRNNGLDASSIGEILLHGLDTNKTLNKLDLSRNSLAIEGAAHIASFIRNTSKSCVLQELHLVDTNIPQAGCGEIFRALKFNQKLRILRLDGNDLLSSGQVLADSLDHNAHLHQILAVMPADPLSAPTATWKQVDLYLRANQAHREFVVHHKYESLHHRLMGRVLHRCDDADVMYHFLRMSSESLLCSQQPRTAVHRQPPTIMTALHKTALHKTAVPLYKTLEPSIQFPQTNPAAETFKLRQCSARGA